MTQSLGEFYSNSGTLCDETHGLFLVERLQMKIFNIGFNF